MHELALAQGIIDVVEAQARAQRFSRVTRVRLVVGALASVEPDALRFGFEAASRGTIAEGAALDIEQPPGAGHCVACGAEVTLSSRGAPCPGCGSFMVLMRGGDELRVEDLEVQ